ncbi:hypothetical protein SLA2020_219910 [Shorea laevis]
MSSPRGSSCYRKMSWTSGKDKSSGWAAFDRKQRQKQGLLPEIKEDPFPPISGSLTALRKCENLTKSNKLSARPFSSVVIPTVNFPDLKENKDFVRPIQDGNSSEKRGQELVEGNNYDLAPKKLKELHSWADNSLIEDVLLAVDNDFEKALTLLQGMVSTSGTGEKEAKDKEQSSTVNDFLSNIRSNKIIPVGNVAKHVDQNSKFLENIDNVKELTNIDASSGNKFSDDDNANMNLVLRQLASIPVEPEWEEDDIYLSHRKDAIKMMRSASHHSRAATNAFLRGDHLSAQQHSLKAREEWLAAQRLNSEAAREILSIRNSENNIWKLDLHGLHAAEAVQALQDHLRKLETNVSISWSVSPKRIRYENRIAHSPSVEKLSCLEKDNVDNQRKSLRERPTSLQVITGIGNHSRGQAALPAAVKSFLIENRYRFDEARPGVITVRPKFRHGSTSTT